MKQESQRTCHLKEKVGRKNNITTGLDDKEEQETKKKKNPPNWTKQNDQNVLSAAADHDHGHVESRRTARADAKPDGTSF
ncbi:hypothetical protein HPP92_028645 [Vanilla planifolia]|uniref:Uncharacterized protein n=1 Tax=Vanilla planifolia TaxID=51239 RepID=A0A835P6N9_VANPL|nr:hypothetical protein HPP92_028645 [Vanilla planifolia]